MSDASTPVSCNNVMDILDAYRRNVLPPAQMEQVKLHLQTCDQCSTELAFREEIAIHLQAAVPAAPRRQQLPAAVRTSIRQMHHNIPETNRKGSKDLLPWMLAAAAIIIVAAGVTQLRPWNTVPKPEIATGTAMPRERYHEENAIQQPATRPAQFSLDDESDKVRQPAADSSLIAELGTLKAAPPEAQVMEPADVAPQQFKAPAREALNAEPASSNYSQQELGTADQQALPEEQLHAAPAILAAPEQQAVRSETESAVTSRISAESPALKSRNVERYLSKPAADAAGLGPAAIAADKVSPAPDIFERRARVPVAADVVRGTTTTLTSESLTTTALSTTSTADQTTNTEKTTAPR